MKKKFVYLIFASLSFGAARAQLSQKSMVGFLTNDKSREWQLADYRKTLGSECKGSGQLFIFFRDGQVQVKSCVNNKIDFRQLTWSLQLVNGSHNDWQIVLSQPVKVGEGTVQVIRIDLPFPEKSKAKKKMIWREFPNCKACPQENITLVSNN